MLISDFVFDLYKSWFEDSAKRVDIKVINSNSGGACIANTREIFASELCLKPDNESPSSIIKKIFTKTRPADITLLIKKITYVNKQLISIIKIFDSDKPLSEKYFLIDELIDETDINSLLKPLMRKAEFYTSRHLLDNDKIQEMIYNEVRISASKLNGFIDKFFELNSHFNQEKI